MFLYMYMHVHVPVYITYDGAHSCIRIHVGHYIAKERASVYI